MRLAGQVALVTGGAVRLGAAICRALADAGARVAIHYHSSRHEAESLVEELSRDGERAAAFEADLADPGAGADLVSRVAEELGAPAVLVNNASLFQPGNLGATSLQSWEDQLAVNLRAPFFLCQSVAAGLPDDGEGIIVNIADARVSRAGGDHLVYRLTKVGLIHLTECLALDLAPAIRVNAVAPGPMLPPPGETQEAFVRSVSDRVPLGRPGGAAPVADAVLYLVGEDFATGTVLRVDGGEWL